MVLVKEPDGDRDRWLETSRGVDPLGEVDNLTIEAELLRFGLSAPAPTPDWLAQILDGPVQSTDEDRAVAAATARRLRQEAIRIRAQAVRARAEAATLVGWELLNAAGAMLGVPDPAVGRSDEASPTAPDRSVGAGEARSAETHRAVGMVMAIRRCDAVAAWAHLVATSLASHRRIPEIVALMTKHVAAGGRLPRSLDTLPGLR